MILVVSCGNGGGGYAEKGEEHIAPEGFQSIAFAHSVVHDLGEKGVSQELYIPLKQTDGGLVVCALRMVPSVADERVRSDGGSVLSTRLKLLHEPVEAQNSCCRQGVLVHLDRPPRVVSGCTAAFPPPRPVIQERRTTAARTLSVFCRTRFPGRSGP